MIIVIFNFRFPCHTSDDKLKMFTDGIEKRGKPGEHLRNYINTMLNQNVSLNEESAGKILYCFNRIMTCTLLLGS